MCPRHCRPRLRRSLPPVRNERVGSSLEGGRKAQPLERTLAGVPVAR
jgi:hypothetical protein